MRSDDTETKLPRKKPSILWWLSGIFCAIALWFLYQLFGPNPRIIVSKETTYLTEPLMSNGLPDYEQYVLRRFREGITPENNAAVLLAKAMWPGSSTPEQATLIAAELGLDTSSIDPELVLREESITQVVSDWQKSLLPRARLRTSGENEAVDEAQQLNADGDAAAMEHSAFVGKIIDLAGSRPWTSSEIPTLADWVKNYEQGLNLIVEASRRPRYYAPSETLLNDQHEKGSLLVMIRSELQDSRAAARCLSVRAMWHVGEGRVENASTDVIALLRLSQLIEQDQTMVGKWLAISLNDIGVEAALSLLSSNRLSANQARQIQAELATLPRFSTFSNIIDYERLCALDLLIALGTQPNSPWLSNLSIDDTKGAIIRHTAVDWNAGLIEINKWFDRAAAANRLPVRSLRRQALDHIESGVAAVTHSNDGTIAWAGTAISRAAKGQFVARRLLTIFNSLSPGFMVDFQDRANTTRDVLQLSAALALFRCETGSYPDELAAPVPGIIEKLPVDLYTSKPFIYKRVNDGYLLYSVGENGIDDGGTNSDFNFLEGAALAGLDDDVAAAMRAKIPSSADDISILIPRPAFEMPKPPQLLRKK